MGFSISELLVILAIVLVIFGTKKLRNIGGDLGGAIKNFRTAMKDGEEERPAQTEPSRIESKEKGAVIEGQVTRERDKV